MTRKLTAPAFPHDPTLAEVAEWLLSDQDVAGEIVFILLAGLGHNVASLPSPAALDAISQSIAASLEKRRLGKHVIEGDGRKAFEEAARWAEMNRALTGLPHD